MKKSILLFLLILTIYLYPNRSNAIGDCCQYLGGICGWTCCDDPNIQAFSPSCENEVGHYFNKKIKKCTQALKTWEKEFLFMEKNYKLKCNDNYLCQSNLVKKYYKDNSESASTKMKEISNICTILEQDYKNKTKTPSAYTQQCGAHEILNNDNICVCEKGFMWDKNKQKCLKNIPISKCVDNPYKDSDKECFCKYGFKWSKIDQKKYACMKIDEDNINDDENSDIFTDVPEGHVYKNAIDYLHQRGIIEGHLDSTFKPNNPITRSELLKILILTIYPEDFDEELYSQNCFDDLIESEWLTPFACYGKEKKWLEKFDNNNFNSMSSVIKADALKIILTAYEFIIPLDFNKTYFAVDVKKKDWFAPFVVFAYAQGIISNENHNRFYPENEITRGEVAQIIYNIILSQNI